MEIKPEIPQEPVTTYIAKPSPLPEDCGIFWNVYMLPYGGDLARGLTKTQAEYIANYLNATEEERKKEYVESIMQLPKLDMVRFISHHYKLGSPK